MIFTLYILHLNNMLEWRRQVIPPADFSHGFHHSEELRLGVSKSWICRSRFHHGEHQRWENHRKTHRKTMGKWWFHGIWLRYVDVSGKIRIFHSPEWFGHVGMIPRILSIIYGEGEQWGRCNLSRDILFQYQSDEFFEMLVKSVCVHIVHIL